MPPKRLKPVEGGGAKVPKIPHYASPKAQKPVKSRLTPREKTWQDVDAGPAWLTQTGRDSPTFFQSKTYKLIDAIYNPPATKPPQQVSISPPPLGRLHVKRNQMKAMHEALLKPENLRSGKRVTLAELAREQGKGRKDSSLGPGMYSPVHRYVEKQVGGYGSSFPKAATGREPAPLSERDSDEDSPSPKSVPPVELDRHLKKHVPVHSWKRATGRNTHIPWNISVDFRREERLIARQEKVRRRRMNRLAKVRQAELDAVGEADVEEGGSVASSSEEEEVKMIAPGVKPKTEAAKEGEEEEDGGESESPSEGASPDPDGESPNALFNLGESSGSSSSSAQRRRRRRRRRRAAEAVKKTDLEPVLVFGDHSDSGSISSTETERAARTKRSKAERRRRIARMKGPDFESVPGRDELWKAQHASAAPDVPYQVKYDLVERDSKKSIKITDPQAREWANALSVGGEGKVSINIDTIVEDYTKGFYAEHKKHLEESRKPQRRQSHAVVGKGKGHHHYDVNSANPHLPWNHPPVVSPFELMAGKPRQPTPQQGPQHPRPQIGTGESDDEHRPLQMALDELVQEGSLFSQLKELVPPEAMVRSTWPAPTASRLGISKKHGLPRIRQSLHNRHGKGRLQILQEFLVDTQETTTRRNREERRRLPKLPWQKDPPPVPLLEYCADSQPPDPPPSGLQEGGPPREGQGGGGALGLPPRSRSQRRPAAEGRESRGSAAGSIRSRGTSQGDGGMESLIEAMAGRHALESQGSMQTALHQMALYGRSTSPLREGEEDALADLVGSSSFRASRCSTNMSVSASALVDLANIVEGETISSRNSPVSTLRSTHLGDFLRANSRGSNVGGATGGMVSPTNQSTPPATFSPSAQDAVLNPFPEP